jgi:pyruvate formate lyase activating enzyme
MVDIFDIKRFALHDGPGIRTTLFMKGCPLHCRWCHNPESIAPGPEEYIENRQVDGKMVPVTRVYGRKVETGRLMEELLRDKVFFDTSGGGITFSGGEPLMQHEALLKMLTEAGASGVHRAVDTSGFADATVLMQVAEHTDLFLYDLKLMSPERHQEYTGGDNRPILENADRLLNSGANVVFRIPVIPGVNDTEEEQMAFAEYLQQRQGLFSEVHLLPYHRTGTDKYRRLGMKYTLTELNAPPEELLQQFRDRLEHAGCKVTYTYGTI